MILQEYDIMLKDVYPFRVIDLGMYVWIDETKHFFRCLFNTLGYLFNIAPSKLMRHYVREAILKLPTLPEGSIDRESVKTCISDQLMDAYCLFVLPPHEVFIDARIICASGDVKNPELKMFCHVENKHGSDYAGKDYFILLENNHYVCIESKEKNSSGYSCLVDDQFSADKLQVCTMGISGSVDADLRSLELQVHTDNYIFYIVEIMHISILNDINDYNVSLIYLY
jgi:hypothetical protein